MQLEPLSLAFGLLILIFSIVIHEVAHGYAAERLGDPTARLAGRLTLNPFKHIDPVGSVLVPVFLVLSHAGILFGWAKPVPYNPYNLKNQRWGEAIVASAGALTNLLLALVFGLVVRFGGESLPAAFISLAAVASFTNLYLGAFNLIPLPPLDGFTVLRGLVPYDASLRLRHFEETIQGSGFAGYLGILLIFSFLFAAPFSLLVNYLFALLVG